jgi:hypothetical protein
MEYSEFKYKYQIYQESVIKNQSDIISYMTECACLESGDLASIYSINEAAMDSIKAGIQKIIAAISGIWKKFIERANELLTTDITYLNKYKDIILKKAPKSKEITMYQYNEDNLKIQIPQFNYNQDMKEWLASENPEKTFTSTFMGSVKFNENLDLKEAIEELIRGANQVDMDGKNLPMDKMFNFCSNYKATCELIKKDTDTILKAQGDVNKLLGQLAPKTNTSTQNTSQQNTNSNATKVDGGNITKYANSVQNNNEAVYSNVLGRYITEADKMKVGATQDNQSSSNSSGASTTGSVADNGVGKDMNVNQNTKDAIKSDLQNNTSDYDAVNKNISKYFKCCGDLLAGKLTVAQEIHKNYMILIRAHVRDYIGETDTKKK